MKKGFYFAVSMVCLMTSCGESKSDKENGEYSTTNGAAIEVPAAEGAASAENDPLAKQIADLEEQRDQIINQIQAAGDSYMASHPDATSDDLNEVTKELRKKSMALKAEIDSLKALQSTAHQ